MAVYKYINRPIELIDGRCGGKTFLVNIGRERCEDWHVLPFGRSFVQITVGRKAEVV